MSKPRALAAFVAALLLVTSLASCADDGRNDASEARPGREVDGPDAAIVGFAHAGGPLVGATVKVLDEDGDELGAAAEPTLPSGAWAVELDDMPTVFSVVATGGTDDTGPFDGTLRAEVPEHDAWTAIHVNLVTTMVSGVLADDQSLTLEEAETDVRTTLGLPMSNDLRSDLRLRDNAFSGRVFMRDAATAGGVTALLDTVEKEAAGHVVHRFAPPPSNDLLGEDVLSGLATKLGGSIVGAAGGAIVGYALNSIGYGNASMQAVLAVQKQLDGVSTQLSLVDDQLAAINEQLDVGAYTTAANILSDTEAAIQNAQADLDTVFGAFQPSDVGQVPPKSKTLGLAIAAFKNYMLNDDNNSLLHNSLARINDQMLTQGGAKAALTSWHAAVLLQSPRFVTQDVQERFDVAFQFWAGYQLRAVNINLEYESYMNGAIDTCTDGVAASPKGATVFMFSGNALCEYTTWTKGPLQDEHAAAQTAGLDDVPTKAAGLFNGIADRATGLVWVRDRVATELGAPDTTDGSNTNTAQCIYEGSPNCQFADAQTALAAMNELPAAKQHGWVFRLPTSAEVVNLVSNLNGYSGWTSYASPGDFLTSDAGCPAKSTVDTVTNAIVDAPIACMFASNITALGTEAANAVWDSDADLSTYVTTYKWTLDPKPTAVTGMAYRDLLNLATSGPTYVCTNDECATTVNHPDPNFYTSVTLSNSGALLMLVADRPAASTLKFWPEDTGALAGS